MTIAPDDTALATATTEPARESARRAGILGVFRDPLLTFLVLAISAGAYLACVVPHFGGIDEMAHFYRSYQISTGQLLPKKYGHAGFSGACIPRDVIVAQKQDSSVYFRHLIDMAHLRAPAVDQRIKPCPDDKRLGLVTFSTFGSPVPYLPQAAAVFVTREAGAGTDVMLIAARFAVLVMYVGIVGFAIRRAPRSKWAICAVGLLPVAVIQSASSVSHDAFTTAIALLVVSSALRALDPPDGTTTKALVIEALVLSAVLGLCKPVYVVIAGCYLLPLLGARRRKDAWPLVFAPGLGVLVSVVWNQAVGDLWKTDAGYFGVRVDDAKQKHELVHAPWNFTVDLARTVYHQAWEWVHTLVTVGSSVTHGPAVLAIVALLAYAVTALLRDREEAARPLHWLQRVLLLVLFVAGVVLVAAANYIYWTTPGSSQVGGIQPRYFMPLVVLVPVAIGSLPFRWARAANARIPLGSVLAPVLVVFCIIVTFRMY